MKLNRHTPLNQNSFEITDNIKHNKAENMRNTMMLNKEEVEEAEEAEMDNYYI
ncbi:hypothetical protein [Rickettsia australis]|uniref:hypothetical protein n=1 Tax=Rickettsia australis TaxID=787 RepID=UPI000318EDBF|nr:hypothetical protein [Rickettsia australis]